MPVTEEEPIRKSNNDGLGALVPLMLLGVLGFFVYRSYRARTGGTTRGMRAQPDSDGINLMSRVSSAVASAGGRVSAHAFTRALYYSWSRQDAVTLARTADSSPDTPPSSHTVPLPTRPSCAGPAASPATPCQ